MSNTLPSVCQVPWLAWPQLQAEQFSKGQRVRLMSWLGALPMTGMCSFCSCPGSGSVQLAHQLRLQWFWPERKSSSLGSIQMSLCWRTDPSLVADPMDSVPSREGCMTAVTVEPTSPLMRLVDSPARGAWG